MNDDNKSNSGQIGQIVAIDDSEKTQDFFLCNKLKNKFITHLDLVVCMYAHILYILVNFPFAPMIKAWITKKVQRLVK
jgi:hypothetical protein